MSLLINSRKRIIKAQVIFIKRQLSDSGEILVSVGQDVSPAEIIGRSFVSAGFRTLNLSTPLGISPAEVKKYLKRQIGQNIFKDELLAMKKGGLLVSERIVVAPTDGQLESLDEKTGDIKINFLPHKVDLPAAVYGVVEQIDKQKSEIIIKTQATRVYGLFGTGKQREGTLKILGGRSNLTGRINIPQNINTHIIVTGGLVYSGALAEAIALGAHGIITGGINGSDYRGIESGRLLFPGRTGTDIGMGLVVCEGFGSVPLGEDIYNVLSEYNNQFAIIDGNRGEIILPSCQSDCMIDIKKVALPPNLKQEIIEPLPVVEAINLSVGQSVRVISSPHMGDQGRVLAIDSLPTLLDSKIRTYLVTVNTKSKKLRMPYLNLEVIDE